VQFSLATEVGTLSQRLKRSSEFWPSANETVTVDWRDSAVLEETKQFGESEIHIPAAADARQKGGARLVFILGGTAVIVAGGLLVSRVVGFAWLCKRRAYPASGWMAGDGEETETTRTGQVSSLSLGNDLLWEARWRDMTHDIRP
jgi:hypothetical protein